MYSVLPDRVVGKGSYGEVNLVKHKSDRKQYVIKKLNLTTSSKRERHAAEQEAQLLSQLRHPNIVTYKESWEGNDCQLYIVMGFCEGGDLYHRLKQQKGELLPERQVVEWFVQIAMALQYLHERNILHRDLKTQNIFLTKTNIIKVGDLGIARVLDNHNDMASTLIGTPYYMSPELFSNKPYNHKSDVWALGCCVYEMSTLKHAFNAKDMNSLVYRIVEGKPQKEEKSQQRNIYNGVTDCTPVQTTPPPPKPLSPDDLKVSSASLATVSNINIDIQLQEDEDPLKRQVQRPQSVGSHHRAGNEHVTRSVHKDSNGRGKPDPSPRLSPVKLPLKSVSGVGSRGGEERWAPSGLLDIQPQATPKPGDTFSVFGEKQMKDVDAKDDTVELLQEAEMQKPKLKVEKGAALSAHKFNTEQIGVGVEVIMENKDDTITLLKGAPTQQPHTSDIQDILESTEKLLEPLPPTLEPEMEQTPLPVSKPGLTTPCQTPPQFSSEPSMSQRHRAKDKRWTHGEQHKSKVAALRPLPPLPVESRATEEKKRNKRSTESKKADRAATSTSVSSRKNGLSPLPQDRPLSARERRRLRQSQESASQPGVDAVRRASYDVTSTKAEHYNAPVSRSASDTMAGTNRKVSYIASLQQEKLLEQRSDDDECSSSASSTERLDGDCREKKTESSDMQDLVHMMTQTLSMDVSDGVSEVDRGRWQIGSTALPEFKLNRKYRDTLVLHGKGREEAENLSLGEIPIGSPSGPAKIRRAIEQLRTDVMKGLGVKLLDKVLEIMEEDDDTKRELCLREQMGDEKYQAYAVMVRQLKFFEDIAFKV
ncbi:hypothetical protein F2P81_012870 [Scophthalmus maximus]|uniref:Serine/threonine-protein kinase Nek4 n=1 Tax=Scophthalmus maximus TaxID=52904 RepID=A0A6A4SYM1_SCOMX|nr:hypothetical protein F2P81_012870 [Scophthalmus maximus]